MTKEFSFTGVSKITLTHVSGENTSRHVCTDFNLLVSDNLDPSSYLDKDGLPEKNGVKPLTQALVQGLIGNIHMAHEKGYWDSAEHLRYAISELERGFIEVVRIESGNF